MILINDFNTSYKTIATKRKISEEKEILGIDFTDKTSMQKYFSENSLSHFKTLFIQKDINNNDSWNILEWNLATFYQIVVK